MSMPLKQILTLKIGDDHETVAVELQNGDKLKGVVGLGSIEMTAIFGKVSIDIPHVPIYNRPLTGGEVRRLSNSRRSPERVP